MQTPKRHFLEWNDAVWALSGPYLTHGATCGLGKVNKKKTVANWLFAQTPTSPYQSQSLHARWPPGCSSIHQVLLKLVQQFCCYGWSKIALSHYFGHLAYTQQLVLPPYKPWCDTCSARQPQIDVISRNRGYRTACIIIIIIKEQIKVT